MALEIKNATITSTMLGSEDHGIFTFVLHLDYGGSGQGAGCISLDGYDKETDKRFFHPKSMALIARICEIAGVDKWEDLKGKHIRVKADWDYVAEIGHLLKDDWLNFKDFFIEQRNAEPKLDASQNNKQV